jgi:hypothetical protein
MLDELQKAAVHAHVTKQDVMAFTAEEDDGCSLEELNATAEQASKEMRYWRAQCLDAYVIHKLPVETECD